MRTLLLIAAVPAALVLSACTVPSPPSVADSVVAFAQGCEKPSELVVVELSRDKYPHIVDHVEDAKAGRTTNGKRWPRVLRINRIGADRRRDAATSTMLSRPGFDRDEYPPAVGRTTLKADVRYVRSGENRGAGAVMGNELRGLCDGTKFTIRGTG